MNYRKHAFHIFCWTTLCKHQIVTKQPDFCFDLFNLLYQGISARLHHSQPGIPAWQHHDCYFHENQPKKRTAVWNLKCSCQLPIIMVIVRFHYFGSEYCKNFWGHCFLSSFDNVHKIKWPVCDIKRWPKSPCAEVPSAKFCSNWTKVLMIFLQNIWVLHRETLLSASRCFSWVIIITPSLLTLGFAIALWNFFTATATNVFKFLVWLSMKGGSTTTTTCFIMLMRNKIKRDK